MTEDNPKRAFKILQGQCTESILSKLGGDKKYEEIESDQDIIEILKLIKGVMFKFYGKNEFSH